MEPQPAGFANIGLIPTPGPKEEQTILDLPGPTAGGHRCDIICFSIIDWWFRFQRPQQMMSQFAEHGHRVFYINLSQYLPHQGPCPFRVRSLQKNVYEVTLSALHPPDVYNEIVEGENAEAILAALAALRQQFSITEALSYVMIASWGLVALAARDRWGWNVLYDCMDEWRSFPGIGPAVPEAEKQLAERCDLLTVTAQRLQDKWRFHGCRPLLVRNAADWEFYREHCRPNGLLHDVTHPLVGYYGAIAEWFDVELVTELAERRPEYTFVLIGGVTVDVSRLQALPNVRLLGQQPYDAMPKYLYHFDACLIPFRVNAITEATDPVKVYEYLSGGKPVVATDLPELASLREHLYLARSRDEFVDQLDRALAEDDPARIAARQSAARQNTWQARYELVADALASATPRASIVIVSHNNVALTKLCLESVLQNTEYPNYEIIVIDNASADGSRQYLRYLAGQHANVHVILNADNVGFARANNQAIARASGQYLVLLNNDTVVPPGWLSCLLRHLGDRSIGMVGPITNFVGNEARVAVDYRTWSEMEAFAEAYTRGYEGHAADIPMLAMFCVALRREVYDKIGPLDERFTIGMFEDDDYAQRLRRAGYRVVCARDAFVHHFGRASFGKLIASGEYGQLFERNRRLFEEKWGISWQVHRHGALRFRPHDSDRRAA
jgi:GT2 family glycosyltransferase/glycosyltransferase involved in cell wall biosynthesis